jgi:hypothetical protein
MRTLASHPIGDTALERHFTPQHLAELWDLDESTIRRIFIDEPGVFKYGKSCRRNGRRDYVTLRIPESVVRRVYAERSRWNRSHADDLAAAHGGLSAPR